MGSSYNVRIPYATMDRSVERQIAEKKDRGFVANMQRLNRAIAPHVVQARDHRNRMELEEKRFSNQVDMLDHTMSAELRRLDEVTQREREADAETSAALGAYLEKNPDKRYDYADLKANVPGLDKDDISGITSLASEERAGVAALQSQRESEQRIKANQLTSQKALLDLQATIQGYQGWSPAQEAAHKKTMAELAEFDETSKSAVAYEKLVAEAKDAEEKAKAAYLANKATEARSGLQARLDELAISTAETNQQLAKAGMEATALSNIQKRQEIAFGGAKSSLTKYQEAINETVAELARMKDVQGKALLQKSLDGMVDTYNTTAYGISVPLLMIDDKGAVSVDYEATQAMLQEDEAIKAVAAQTDNPELLAQALLRQLRIESVDTAFLTKVPTALIGAGKDAGFVERVMSAYSMSKEDILSARRAKDVANRPKNVPHTEESITSGAETKARRKEKTDWAGLVKYGVKNLLVP